MDQDQSGRRDSPDAEDESTSWPSEPTQPSPADEREPDAEPTPPTDEPTPSQEPAPAPDQAPTWSTPSDEQPSWAERSAPSEAPSHADEPPAEAASEPASEPAAEAAEPTWSEREAWPAEPTPSDEPPAEPTAAEPASTDAGGWAAGEAAEPAWPTEPPAAGSADADTWPTSAPEREDEPAWREPPPSEVEAYPAGPTPEEGAAVAGMATAAGTAAHSVPAAESATGESTQCPRCGTENRPGLSFCRNCGQRLIAAGVASTVERPGAPEGTMACPRCGTHNRAGVAFCQNCGANLRGTAPGYVPPAVGAEAAAAPAAATRGGAVLGPVVLLIGLAGIITGYLLPFLYGSGSLFERAMGEGGYGISFWSAYPADASLADQVYYGLAAPVPLLGLVLLLLTVAGFARAAPGAIQVVGLLIALLWSVGLIVGFGAVELAGNWSGDLVGMLRVLTPAGIIFFLSALIILIGTLTRFARS